MESPENDKWLDKALRDVIASNKPKTDFIQWKQSHPEVVEILTTRASQKFLVSPSSLATRRIILRSPITKLAAAAMIIMGILAITNQVRHLDNRNDVTESLESKVLRPFEYEVPEICTIPLKMNVGMYVQVKNYNDLVLEKVDCRDIGKDNSDSPCYFGCASFDVKSNFDVKIRAGIEKIGNLTRHLSINYDSTDIVPGDGNYHHVKIFVKGWGTQVLKAAPGNDVHVGEIHITVIPDA